MPLAACFRYASALRTWPTAVRELMALRRQRRALAALDPAALHDLGLSRAEALAEARRPFWDVPAAWRVCQPRARTGAKYSVSHAGRP